MARRRPGEIVRTDSGRFHACNIFSCPRLQHCTRSKACGAARQLSAARQGPAKAGQRREEQRRGVEVRLVHIMCARVREVGTVRKSVPARWRLTRRAGRQRGKGGGREDGYVRAPGSAGRRRNAWQRSRRRFPPSEASVVSRVSSKYSGRCRSCRRRPLYLLHLLRHLAVGHCTHSTL